MKKKYYSDRSKNKKININNLYYKLQNLYLLFRDKDYFQEKAEITKNGNVPDSLKRIAAIKLSFQPFPITKWEQKDVTEDNIFDTIEFLYEHCSKPGEWTSLTDESGYYYYGYESYDEVSGKNEFREYVNIFLNDYSEGFELNHDGEVVSLGENGLEHILAANIIPYDKENVDQKIIHAINIWKKRKTSLEERKEAIRELADVFEWLKKKKDLQAVLDKKDDSALFDIANNFALRHHNPNQKQKYDKNIWYSWMFHFYLASYHAIIRLLIKNETEIKMVSKYEHQ